MLSWVSAGDWSSIGVVLIALGLCVWAWRTGRPEPLAPKLPRHARWTGEGETTPLAWPDITVTPLPMERDGGMAQRLPGRDELPWRTAPYPRTVWPPRADHDLDH